MEPAQRFLEPRWVFQRVQIGEGSAEDAVVIDREQASCRLRAHDAEKREDHPRPERVMAQVGPAPALQQVEAVAERRPRPRAVRSGVRGAAHGPPPPGRTPRGGGGGPRSPAPPPPKGEKSTTST